MNNRLVSHEVESKVAHALRSLCQTCLRRPSSPACTFGADSAPLSSVMPWPTSLKRRVHCGSMIRDAHPFLSNINARGAGTKTDVHQNPFERHPAEMSYSMVQERSLSQKPTFKTCSRTLLEAHAAQGMIRFQKSTGCT